MHLMVLSQAPTQYARHYTPLQKKHNTSLHNTSIWVLADPEMGFANWKNVYGA